MYGVRPARPEGSRLILELTGIGGAMEEEDQSLTAGALREVEEEIGCPVRLLACRETVIVSTAAVLAQCTIPAKTNRIQLRLSTSSKE